MTLNLIELADLAVQETNFTDLFDLNITHATLFLVPLLKDLVDLKAKKMSFTTFLINEAGLTNCFINDKLELYSYCLYLSFDKRMVEKPLLFRDKKMISMDAYISSLEKCIDIYETENNIVYVYQLDEEFYPAYEYFLNSEYSKLSRYSSYYANPYNDVLLALPNKIINQDKELQNIIRKDLLVRQNVPLGELFTKISEKEKNVEQNISQSSINKLFNFILRFKNENNN